MGSNQPILVDKSVTTFAHLLGCLGHNVRAIVGDIFVAIIDLVAIVTAVVAAMIQGDVGMGKARVAGLGAGGNGYPVGMADMAVAYYRFIFKNVATGCIRDVPLSLEGYVFRGF